MSAPAVAVEPTRGDLLRALEGLEEQLERMRNTLRGLNAENEGGVRDA